MFQFIKIKSKQAIMLVLYLILELWSLIGKRKLNNPQKIIILFLRNLGIGDLVMLSPVILKIKETFPDSQIDLISWFSEVIDLPGINFIKLSEANFKETDLIISPTLNLRHIPYLFKAKNFIGYFAWTRVQSNLKVKKFGYKLRGEHYLIRGISLLKSLNKKIGENLEKDFYNRSVTYPKFLEKIPNDFDLYKGYKYLAIAPVSKWLDRQWPAERFTSVIEGLLRGGFVERVVFLGDSSEHDKKFINILLNSLEKKFPKYFFINASGNDLKESIFIIKNSFLFIGLDSAPAHFAYFVAPRVLSIFVTVDPLWRLPAVNGLGMVRCVLPNIFNSKIYSGLSSVNSKKSRKYINAIRSDQVFNEAKALISKV